MYRFDKSIGENRKMIFESQPANSVTAFFSFPIDCTHIENNTEKTNIDTIKKYRIAEFFGDAYLNRAVTDSFLLFNRHNNHRLLNRNHRMALAHTHTQYTQFTLKKWRVVCSAIDKAQASVVSHFAVFFCSLVTKTRKFILCE